MTPAEPGFDGALRTDAASTARAAEDFGHLVSRRPRGVLEAASVEDVTRLVRHCRDAGLRAAPRGQGHSVFGQSQVEDGLVVDLHRLRRVHSLTARSATVDAGLRWSDLVRLTLAEGLVPPVLTDYLDLSVGGTLSMGGITGTSFRCGAQVDQVDELLVVTGGGDVLTCSEREEPALFEAALAGLGQTGIIVRATVRLVAAAPAVRVFRLRYPGPEEMAAALGSLAAEERFEYLLGILTRTPGSAWSASIEAMLPAGPPADHKVLAGLGPRPDLVEVEERTAPEWAWRVDEAVAELQNLGLWGRPHPWLDLFVAGSALERFLPELLASPAVEGPGPLRVLVYPLQVARFRRPLLRLPDEESAFLVDVLSTAPDGAGPAMVRANRTLFERNRDLGGTLYPIAAVPMTREDWERHFGPHWPRLVETRRRYDPDSVLTPGPGIF